MQRASKPPAVIPPPPPLPPAHHYRLPCTQVLVRADSALIVNTKGGGHAFLGLHLAKKLLAQGHSVTIL